MFKGEIKVGAVYQSRGIANLRRMVTRVHSGIVEYTLYQRGLRTAAELTEKLFREFTRCEIPPEEL